MITAQTTLDSKAKKSKKGKLSLPKVSKESPKRRRRSSTQKRQCPKRAKNRMMRDVDMDMTDREGKNQVRNVKWGGGRKWR